MEVETIAPQPPQPLPSTSVAPPPQPAQPQHHSPYSPPIQASQKPTLPLPASLSPREPPIHVPSHPHSRRPSASGIKESAHAPVQNPHHVVPVTNGHHPSNGQQQYYPPHSDTLMDNLSRVQTVTSYNQASLEAQHRRLEVQGKDIERLEGMVGQLQREMRGFQEVLEGLRAELRHRSVAPASSPGDETLELFAKNLTSMSAKVQEVEGVKMQVEIMKRKINRLEEASANGPHGSVGYSSPREGSHHAPIATNNIHATPAAVPKIATPVHNKLQPIAGAAYSHHTPSTEPAHPVETENSTAAGGWVSVNSSSGSKRGYPNGMDGRSDTTPFAPGSPKRPKLATMEPQVNMDPRGPISYDRMDTDEEYTRTHSRDSYGESGNTPTSYAAYPSQPSTANSDDGWRQDGPRTHDQRTSPKRGRGGRVGRPRKSLPNEFEAGGTPEWEKPAEWANSQVGPDGYYQAVTPGGSKRSSLVRRGSGGGGSASARAVTVEHEVPRPQQQQQQQQQQLHDPYAHTKKTRTKPTRNAEGILIRKDGRPDMRSHSSAANLRKVHARKEQERAMEQGLAQPAGTPTQQAGSMDTPSPKENGTTDTTSTQDRHAAIMKQIFPHGVEESKERANYASKLFPAVNSSNFQSAKIKAETHTPPEEVATPEHEHEHEREDTTRGTSASASSEGRVREKSASVPPPVTQQAVEARAG